MNKSQLDTHTLAIHGDSLTNSEEANAATVPPIAVSTTFDLDGDAQFVYSRAGQPVWRKVERVFEAIERGGTLQIVCSDRRSNFGGHAAVYASGSAAVVACLNHFRPQRLLFSGGYHGTFVILENYSKTHQEVPLLQLQLQSTITSGDLLWIESPRNPDGSVINISRMSKEASVVGAIVVVDATLAPAPTQFCLDLGCDIVMYATTKFHGGHSDLLGGVLISKSESVSNQLKLARTANGNVMGSLESWLLLRSLKTFPLRFERMKSTSLFLVSYLSYCLDASLVPDFAKMPEPVIKSALTYIHHASLPDCIGHDVAAKFMDGHSSVFSVELATAEDTLLFWRHLKLFKRITSFGGCESSADYRYMHDKLQKPTLIRMSVGLEDQRDLANDLRQALIMTTKTH